MGELWLVRHGETAWSLSGQHTGRTDVPLTAHGEEQARALRPQVAEHPFAAVLCSPRSREVRTAELAGLSATTDEDLGEWDYGALEGRTTDEVRETLPGWVIWDGGAPLAGGETLEQVGARAARVLARVRPLLDHGDVCLVGHGHFSRVLAAVYLGLGPLAARHLLLHPACVSVLGHERDTPALVRWNA